MVPRRNLCFPSISEIWLPKESSRGSAQPTVLTRILNFCPQCQRKVPWFIASWVWIQIRYKLVCKRKVVCICLLSSSISCYSWLCSNYFRKSQNIEDCLGKLFLWCPKVCKWRQKGEAYFDLFRSDGRYLDAIAAFSSLWLFLIFCVAIFFQYTAEDLSDIIPNITKCQNILAAHPKCFFQKSCLIFFFPTENTTRGQQSLSCSTCCL